MNFFFNLRDLKYLGRNVIIGRSVRIRKPHLVEIDDNSIIDDFTYISTPAKIGKNCHIGANVTINGGASKITIKNFVDIGANTVISTASTNFINPSISSAAIPKKYQFGTIVEQVKIDNYAVIGSSSVILPGVNLPEGFACGAMTLLKKKNYEKWCLYAGYNADFILKRDKKKFLKKIKKYYG